MILPDLGGLLIVDHANADPAFAVPAQHTLRVEFAYIGVRSEDGTPVVANRLSASREIFSEQTCQCRRATTSRTTYAFFARQLLR